jgi:hypothetical protein
VGAQRERKAASREETHPKLRLNTADVKCNQIYTYENRLEKEFIRTWLHKKALNFKEFLAFESF